MINNSKEKFVEIITFYIIDCIKMYIHDYPLIITLYIYRQVINNSELLLHRNTNVIIKVIKRFTDKIAGENVRFTFFSFLFSPSSLLLYTSQDCYYTFI